MNTVECGLAIGICAAPSLTRRVLIGNRWLTSRLSYNAFVFVTAWAGRATLSSFGDCEIV